MLILAVAKYLNKLFENGSMAAMAPLGKLRRVMEVAINLALVLVVRVLGTEDSWTYGACEMLDMVFAVQCCDVGATQGAPTLMTEEVQSPKIVCFAKWELATSILRIDREKLRGDDFSAVLQEKQLAQPPRQCEPKPRLKLLTWHLKHSR